MSDQKTIKCGIPQGSILGPLLFILYINDIANSSSLLKFILFADDTNVFYSCKDINNLNSILNFELGNVTEWLIANELSINIKKTNYIIFRARQRKIDLDGFSIKINNQLIERKKNTTFLGVIILEHLSRKDHISTVAGKISRSIGIISKSRFFISQTSLFMLYYSLVYPYLYYGNIIWGSTYQTNLYRLKILQNRIIRIITNLKYDAHTAPLFYKYNILKLDQINILQMGLFMYSVNSKSTPTAFQDMFIKSSQIHSYSTRQSNNFRSEQCRTNIKKFTVVCQGLNYWNSLPDDLKSKPTLSSFKSNLKKYLITSSKP